MCTSCHGRKATYHACYHHILCFCLPFVSNFTIFYFEYFFNSSFSMEVLCNITSILLYNCCEKRVTNSDSLFLVMIVIIDQLLQQPRLLWLIHGISIIKTCCSWMRYLLLYACTCRASFYLAFSLCHLLDARCIFYGIHYKRVYQRKQSRCIPSNESINMTNTREMVVHKTNAMVLKPFMVHARI